MSKNINNNHKLSLSPVDNTSLQKKINKNDFFNRLQGKLMQKSVNLSHLIGLSKNISTNTKRSSSRSISKSIRSNNPTSNLKSNNNERLVLKKYNQERIKTITKKQEPKELPFKNEKQLRLQKVMSIRLINPKIAESMSTNSTSFKVGLNKNLKIEDFLLLGYLGRGKFGNVYSARHNQTNFHCAIKKMSKQLLSQKVIIQICRQLKIQSFINHPNIVQMYTFFWDSEYIYMVMQMCCSGHVFEKLQKEGKIQQKSVKNIIRQVCYAVEYMHQNHIIHRDIKPQNILLNEGVVKICDFGWSVYTSCQQLRNTFCGTPLYASPQLLQYQHYNNKIDIWGIGMLVYELLYGFTPFDIQKQEDLEKIVLHEVKFPKNHDISPKARKFIQRCLVKNPKFRPTINELLEDDFLMGYNLSTSS